MARQRPPEKKRSVTHGKRIAQVPTKAMTPPSDNQGFATARTEDQQLRAFEAAAKREISLPVEASIVGEPVVVISIHYGGHPRAGLSAHCRKGTLQYRGGLADLTFSAGSKEARFVARYRTWLGTDEPPQPSASPEATPHQRSASRDDIMVGKPVELIVLSCKSDALRCRQLGTAHELTLRTALGDEVPGEIITVLPTKQWARAGQPFLSGSVGASRSNVRALGLSPLALHPHGQWDPEREYWGEVGAPFEKWQKPIIARGKRPMFELEQVVPGKAPGDIDGDPIVEASELNAAGQRKRAQDRLMDLLAMDLRCIDAHAHLGNFAFVRRPAQAMRHYEMGTSIGALSLGKDFDGVLAWGLLDNRPFLRCMNGLGLCAWRLGKRREATAIFRKMLWLNPSDNQGARFNLAAVEAGRTWEESNEVP
jgi:hypothetical protein